MIDEGQLPVFVLSYYAYPLITYSYATTQKESDANVRNMVGWGDSEMVISGAASTDPHIVELPGTMKMRDDKKDYLFLCSNKLTQGGSYVNDKLTNVLAGIGTGNAKIQEWINFVNPRDAFHDAGRERTADIIDMYLTDTAGARVDEIDFCCTLDFER